MTTSTNTGRTRRRTAKAPDDTAPAMAATDTRDVARPKRKAAKPPAGAAPSTAPSDATAGRAKRKSTKPPVGARPAIPAGDASAADRTERSVVDPLPEIMPSSRATSVRLVDRIERRVAKPPTDLGPSSGATRAAGAPAADAAAPTGATGGKVLDRVARGVAMVPDEAGPAIGATETRLFDCPRCARPVATGTRRCPGCGVRLFMGVSLRRVGAIMAAGIALGVVVGGGLTAAAVVVGGQASPSAVTSGPSPTGFTPSPTPRRTLVAVPVGPPAAALAALSGTAVVNGRITVDTATLAGTLGRKGATTIEVARAIRSLAADAALGLDLTGQLAQWTDAAQVMTELDDIYRAVAKTARTALRASLSDAAGYRRAGAEMLKVLDGLEAVDAASRTLAATVDLELPPLDGSGSGASTAPAATTAP